MDESELNLRQFAHRHNSNAVVDSICLTCFLTAGSSPAEADLKAIERRHQCELEGRMSPSHIISVTLPGNTGRGHSRRRSLEIRKFSIVYGKKIGL
jgi:hypothetical protein